MAGRTRPEPIPGMVGVIDIGTSKVCCIIAAPAADGCQLLGLGHQRSGGIKTGVVVDVEAAERAVRAAVSQAERMAGIELDTIVLSVACGRLRSQSFIARAPVAGPIVARSDIDRVIAGGEAYAERSGRGVVQVTRSDWRLDGVKGVRDPLGLAGQELSVELTAVTADEAPLRNLLAVIERCHLGTGGLVAAPFASAIAVATSEERHAGALVVDIGAGVTSLAAFADGRLVHADVIPVGGNHVTFDIARNLVSSVADAERIKTLYGTLVKAQSDDSEVISYPGAGEDEGTYFQTTRAALREIITPRIAGHLALLEERLTAAGLGELAARRIILTGGGSQLLGLDQAWSRRLGGPVRLARPRPIGRMPANMCSPAFSTAIGLALGEVSPDAAVRPGRQAAAGPGGYLGRMRRWIAESF